MNNYVCIYFEIIITISKSISKKEKKKKSTKIPSEKSVKEKKERKKNSPGIHKIDLLQQQGQPRVIIEWLLEFALLSQQLQMQDFV